MRLKISQAHLAILFAIFFVSVGWIAPAAYASYAPEGHYIEVHSFNASNATTTDNAHMVCFDRDIKQSSSATVFTKLYLVSDGDSRVEINSNTMQRYFQSGDTAVETRMGLPEHIQTGEYRYVLVIEMGLARDRVYREFEFTSDTFTIAESGGMSNITKTFNC